MTGARSDLVSRLQQSIPSDLREGKWWLLWKLEDDRKKPYYAGGAKRNGKLDSAQDRARLVSFSEAANVYQASKRYTGLGVALGPYGNQVLSGIDLDDCRKNGNLTPRAQQIIEKSGSYAEISPSGEGVKIFGVGDIGTRGGGNGDGLEIYSRGRFFTVTGEALNGAHLADLTEVATLARRMFSSGAIRVDFSAKSEIREGSRNTMLASLAGRWHRAGLTGDALVAALQVENERRCKPPLSAEEVEIIGRSIDRYPVGDQSGAPIVLRSALEIVTKPTPARWLLRPYLEQDVLAVMSGDYDTFKSFLSLDWSLHIAAGKPWHRDRRNAIQAQPVVFISAEGRGLSKRLRAWVKHYFPDEVPESVLKRLKFYAIELAVNLSDPHRVAAMAAAIEGLGITPALIVVDTLSKNSTGVEEHNSAMAAFLNAVRAGLRDRYGCTILFIHHVGHAQKDRPRGPINLIGDTDAAFMVERLDRWNVVLRTDRLKDTEPPEPLQIEARVVQLSTNDEDGEPETSLVLLAGTPHFVARVIPSGKNQRRVWDALCASEVSTYSEADLRALFRKLVGGPRVPEVLEGLRKAGWLVERAGRWDFLRS